MPKLVFPTAIGDCAIEWNDAGVTAFRLPHDREIGARPETSDTRSPPASAPSWLAPLVERVQRHLRGEAQDFGDVPYDFASVSEFQRAVYAAALSVKAGQTQTYGWIASQIGQPVAASRAVGTALGQNPWPLLVPCHRFVGANGNMTGFSGPGGIQTKLRLLAIEGAELDLQ